MKHSEKMQLTSLDQLIDKHIGPIGTPDRDRFEYELKLDQIGHIIRETRLRRNLTQEQLGALVGVKKAQISKLENNTKAFRIDTILKVLDALGAKLRLIVEYNDQEEFMLD